MSLASAPSVLVLDDDRDFCELVGAFLSASTGVECVTAHSVAELVAKGDVALACILAILDVNLGAGEPTGLDALDWLRSHAFGGRIVFLTGHARSHPRIRDEARASRLTVLEKPIDVETLMALVPSRSLVQHAGVR